MSEPDRPLLSFTHWTITRCDRCGAEGEAPGGSWMAWAMEHRCESRQTVTFTARPVPDEAPDCGHDYCRIHYPR